MNKRPSLQFYPADWLKDPDLQMCSMNTIGIWINLLCRMWEAKEEGILRGQPGELALLVGARPGEFTRFLKEAKEHKFCDVLHDVTNSYRFVTIKCRRMNKLSLEREGSKHRMRKHRGGQGCDDVTPHSSSSSSTSKKKYLTFVFLTDTEHDKLVKRFGSDGARAKIKTLDDGIAIHGYNYKSHYRVILKWAEDDKPSAAVIADKKCSRSFCKESAVYGGVDDTGQKYYLCEIHKPKGK